MRKPFKRFITWLYVRYVVVPDFKKKLAEVAETDELLNELLDDEFEIEFEASDEFISRCQDKLH
jgi:hypothetical protein